MRFSTPLYLALFLLFLLSAGSPYLQAKPNDNEEVTIRRQIEPMYPIWAYTHGVSKGYAKVAFYVDEFGEVSDLLAIEYTYEPFADELMSTILKWDFVPARRGGEPVKTVCHAYWEFLPDRPIETNAMFDASKRMEGIGKGPFRSLKYREGRELDSKVRMLAFPGLVQVRGNSELESEQQSVRAKISFFVVGDGRVALPHVVSSSDPLVNSEIEVAFKNASFERPVFKGDATIALLERTYDIPVVWVDEEKAQSL